MHEFGTKFSDIDAIYLHMLAADRLQVQPTKWWKHLWNKIYGQSTSDSARVVNFMSSLNENQVVDLAAMVCHDSLIDSHEATNPTNSQTSLTAVSDAAVINDATGNSEKLPMFAHSQASLTLKSTIVKRHSSRQSDLSVPGIHPADNATDSNEEFFSSQNVILPQNSHIELQEVVVHSPKGFPQTIGRRHRASACRSPTDTSESTDSLESPSFAAIIRTTPEFARLGQYGVREISQKAAFGQQGTIAEATRSQHFLTQANAISNRALAESAIRTTSELYPQMRPLAYPSAILGSAPDDIANTASYALPEVAANKKEGKRTFNVAKSLYRTTQLPEGGTETPGTT